MNETLKWVLIAGAGLLVYKYLKDQASTVANEGAGESQAGGEAGGGDAGAGNGSSGPVTEQQLSSYALQRQPAGWDGKLNADQWNYYYTEVSGVQQTAELHPVEDRGYRMTVDEYFAARSSKGLQGLNGRVSPLVWMT